MEQTGSELVQYTVLRSAELKGCKKIGCLCVWGLLVGKEGRCGG